MMRLTRLISHLSQVLFSSTCQGALQLFIELLLHHSMKSQKPPKRNQTLAPSIAPYTSCMIIYVFCWHQVLHDSSTFPCEEVHGCSLENVSTTSHIHSAHQNVQNLSKGLLSVPRAPDRFENLTGATPSLQALLHVLPRCHAASRRRGPRQRAAKGGARRCLPATTGDQRGQRRGYSGACRVTRDIQETSNRKAQLRGLD